MADTITIKLTGPLREFVNSMAGRDSMYENVSEYLRDLVRHDYDAKKQQLWGEALDEIHQGMTADESEFVSFDVDAIIAEAKAEFRSEGK